MCDILKMAGRGAKQTAIWDSKILGTDMYCTFDLIVLKVILGSFGAFVSWPLTRKWLAIERNGAKFHTKGHYNTYVGYI